MSTKYSHKNIRVQRNKTIYIIYPYIEKLFILHIKILISHFGVVRLWVIFYLFVYFCTIWIFYNDYYNQKRKLKNQLWRRREWEERNDQREGKSFLLQLLFCLLRLHCKNSLLSVFYFSLNSMERLLNHVYLNQNLVI